MRGCFLSRAHSCNHLLTAAILAYMRSEQDEVHGHPIRIEEVAYETWTIALELLQWMVI